MHAKKVAIVNLETRLMGAHFRGISDVNKQNYASTETEKKTRRNELNFENYCCNFAKRMSTEIGIKIFTQKICHFVCAARPVHKYE